MAPRPKQLPAPKEPILEEQSQQLFQIASIRPYATGRGEEPLAIIRNKSGDVAVSHHTTPQFLESFPHEYQYGNEIRQESLPGLFLVFQRLTDPGAGVTLLVRALETRYADYNRQISALSKSTTNGDYQSFITEHSRWVNPKAEGQRFTHDLMIWGPAYDLIPGTEGKPTAALDYSTLLKYRAVGPLLRDSLLRLPVRPKLLKADNRTGRTLHLDYAAPDEYIKDPRYFAINHRLFGYWLGEVNPDNIGPILASNLDLLIHVSYANNTFYHTAVLRGEARQPEGLDAITDTLNENLGKWERITNTPFSKTDIMTAVQAYMVGSAPLPESWGTPALTDWRTVFSAIAGSIKPASDLQGSMSPGKNGSIKGGSILINPQNSPAIAVTGSSKTAGKSTTIAGMVLPHTPPIWIPLTVTAGDRCFDWGARFGGTVHSLTLPDAHTVLAEEDRNRNRTYVSDKKRVQDRQHKLHTQDAREAQEFAYKLLESWHNHGRPFGLPLVFKPETESIRTLNWYQVFLDTMLKEDGLKFWYESTGVHTMFVVDNFSRLGLVKRAGSSGILGHIPVDVVTNLAQTLGDMIVNLANKGGEIFIAAHATQDFDVIDPGYYNRFPLGIELGRDDNHQMGRIIRPNSDGEVYVRDLFIHLPYEIRKDVERLNPGGASNNGHLPDTVEDGIETMGNSQI